MSIFKRRRYRLPKVPAEIESVFRSLCQPVDLSELTALRDEFEQELTKYKGGLKANRRLSADGIEQLASACRYLIEHYSEYSSAQRGLVIGAIRYFIAPNDPLPESSFASGLTDDAAVLNYVLEELGVEGHFVEL